MSKEKLERFESIRISIKKEIKEGANEKALELVVSKSVEKEVEVRTDLIMAGTQMYIDTKKALDKCQPDDVKYPVATDDKGHPTDEDPIAVKSFSVAKMKEMNGLKKKLGELDAALLLALGENQDYSKLKNLTSKK